MSPEAGFHKLVRDAFIDKELEERLINQTTRRSVLDGYDLDEKEKADIMESTAGKISDIVVDFNPAERYGWNKRQRGKGHS